MYILDYLVVCLFILYFVIFWGIFCKIYLLQRQSYREMKRQIVYCVCVCLHAQSTEIEMGRETRRGRSLFSSTASLPNSHNGIWHNVPVRSQELGIFWASHAGAGAQELRQSCVTLPRPSAGILIGIGIARDETSDHAGCQHCNWLPYPLSHSSGSPPASLLPHSTLRTS